MMQEAMQEFQEIFDMVEQGSGNRLDWGSGGLRRPEVVTVAETKQWERRSFADGERD
jgi:hypothetical protein